MSTAESISMGFPPELTISKDRTHCEACKLPLDPAVMHRCAGNEEWKPDPAPLAFDTTPVTK